MKTRIQRPLLYSFLVSILIAACSDGYIESSEQSDAAVSEIDGQEKSLLSADPASPRHAAKPEMLELSRPVVLSYFWPVTKHQANPRELTMESPKFIDIATVPAHGNQETRDYWTQQGKVLLSRVNPFRNSFDPEVLRGQLNSALASAAGVSIDEVVFGKWKPTQQETVARELERARAEYPDKYIFVWDASPWNDETAPGLRRIAAASDAFAMQIYISTTEAKSRGLGRIDQTINKALSYAPEIKTKIIVGIGAYKKMRSHENEDLSEHLVAQVRYIACKPELHEILGIGIYAPLYLTLSEQLALDGAIQEYLLPAPDNRKCTKSVAFQQ